MKARTRCTLAVSLSIGATSGMRALPANVVFARPAGGEAAAESVAPQPVPSVDEVYRAGVELEKKQNYAEAMRSYRVAADKGHTGAQIAIGNLYAEGRGVQQDYAAALRWYRMAADKGNYEAQNNVGWFYLSGWGVPQDYAEAMRWLRKAADQGNEVSQRNIGMMYLNGLGVPQNRDEAIRWFRMAAAKGDEDAKDALQTLGAK